MVNTIEHKTTAANIILSEWIVIRISAFQQFQGVNHLELAPRRATSYISTKSLAVIYTTSSLVTVLFLVKHPHIHLRIVFEGILHVKLDAV